jgi:PilZ domain
LEKRRSQRFPLMCVVRYKTLNKHKLPLNGNGKTVNVSSSGVLFTSSDDIPVGSRLELSISWPVRLNDHCLLNLIVSGKVVRQAAKGLLVVDIKRYEFRTQSPGKKLDQGSSELAAGTQDSGSFPPNRSAV